MHQVHHAYMISSKKDEIMSESAKHEKLGLKNKTHLANAQAINNHPDVVDKVIKQAKENDDIPTKTAVINQIRYEKEKTRKENAKPIKSNIEMKLVEQRYIIALEEIITILPTEPPKDWSEEAFGYANGFVKIIMKRLEAFNEHGYKSLQ